MLNAWETQGAEPQRDARTTVVVVGRRLQRDPVRTGGRGRTARCGAGGAGGEGRSRPRLWRLRCAPPAQRAGGAHGGWPQAKLRPVAEGEWRRPFRRHPGGGRGSRPRLRAARLVRRLPRGAAGSRPRGPQRASAPDSRRGGAGFRSPGAQRHPFRWAAHRGHPCGARHGQSSAPPAADPRRRRL